MIRLNDINKYYKNGSTELHVLKDINLFIDKGEFVAIVGPSGSGKSSLLNLIGFLDNDYSGEYFFKSEMYREANDKIMSNIRKKNVGFIYQNFKLIDNNTVFENIALPLLYDGKRKNEIKLHVTTTLNSLGLTNYENKFPTQLSGGEQQRVAIARAIINNPEFIIADEPTGSLDVKTATDVMNILKEIHNSSTTIVMVTHDMKIASQANRVINLVDGRIFSDMETNTI